MRPAAAILLVCTLAIVGCSMPPQLAGTTRVEPGRYDEAFDRARETLVDLGFTLNRIDAAAGVLTTQPLPATGIAAPWERQQASLAGEFADSIHPQSRSVRIEFVPAALIEAIPSDDARNQIKVDRSTGAIDTAEPLAARVTVLIERTYRPGLRPQIADVVRSRRSFDPRFDAGRAFSVIIQRDADLENVIAQRIGNVR